MTHVTADEARRWREAGLWRERCLADLVADNGAAGQSAAVTDVRGTLTFDALQAAVRAVATWLTATTAAGDVIAMQTRGSADLLVVHLACSATGRVAMPLSHTFTRQETDHLLDVSAARVFVQADPAHLADPRSVEQLRERHRDLALIGSEIGDAPGVDFDFRRVIAAGAPAADFGPSDPDAGHLVMISSGTTQLPKASLWTDNNLWFIASQYAQRVHLTAEDVALQVAPANTGSTGYLFPLLTPALFGARSVMLDRWSPAAALDAIEEHRITIASAVPTQMIKMVQEQRARPRDVSSLRVFSSASAKLEEAHARRVEETLGCRVQAAYGASDGGGISLTSVDDDDHHRLRSVGRPLPGVDLRIVTPGGDPAGTSGELRWRTPSKTLGYLNDPQNDGLAYDAQGYYCSGDLGELDEHGYLFIIGRSRDMIIRGGQNIHPGEIETAVLTHPAVADVAAIGLPDEVYGERTAVVVVTQPGQQVDLAQLCDWLREHGLAAHKLPERLELIDDLPRNIGGKVDKAALIARLTD